MPDKNQELKLIQKVDRFRRGPRRALGMDSVTIIGGQPIIFRAGFIFEGGHIFFSQGVRVFSKYFFSMAMERGEGGKLTVNS